jgi:hypothetical protein
LKNKKGVNPTLTKILIGTVIGVFVLVSLFTAYTTFLTDNGVSVSDETQGYFADLTTEGDVLNSFSGNVTAKESVNAIWEGVSNVFVVGIGAIGKFFQMIPILSTVLGIVEKAIPGFSSLFGIFVLIITIYITMQIIASKRGTTAKA